MRVPWFKIYTLIEKFSYVIDKFARIIPQVQAKFENYVLVSTMLYTFLTAEAPRTQRSHRVKTGDSSASVLFFLVFSTVNHHLDQYRNSRINLI